MRSFKCLECKQTYTTIKTTGRLPLYCNTCKPLLKAKALQASKLLRHTKECLYRHCGRQFIDTSGKGQDYCIKEHARREKAFRQNKVSSESQFKHPDPISGAKPQRTYTCLTCKEQWLPERFPRDQSCLECRTKARTKNCL